MITDGDVGDVISIFWGINIRLGVVITDGGVFWGGNISLVVVLIDGCEVPLEGDVIPLISTCSSTTSPEVLESEVLEGDVDDVVFCALHLSVLVNVWWNKNHYSLYFPLN